jgi:hypothetical protein
VCRYVKARLCRAKVHEQKGDVKLAYDDYKRALSYEPNNAQARRLEFACPRFDDKEIISTFAVEWTVFKKPSISWRKRS